MNSKDSKHCLLALTLFLGAWMGQAFMPLKAWAGSSAPKVNSEVSRQPIKIGFIASLTGVAAESSKQMVNGIQLYLDQVHHKIAGRDVQLIVENDESNPATARSKLKKLIEQDKVQIIDGILASHIAYALAPDVEKYKVPAVFAVTAADDLTQRKRCRWIVRAGWAASQASHPFGQWAYTTLGYRKIVILGLDYPFGWEVAGGFQKSFEGAGGKIVQKIWAPLGFTDFSPFIKQIDKDADAVFFATALAGAPIIAKQYFQLGPHLPVIGGGVSFDESLLQEVGDPAIGVKTVLVYSAALDTPENKRFVREYEQKFGRPPTQLAEFCYTSGMWIDKAIQSIGGDVEDRERLLAALQKVELPKAPRGPIKVDDFGNPIENVYVRKVEKVAGHLQNSVIHTFPNVGQFWTYDPKEFLKQPVYTKDYPPCRYCSAAK